MAVGLIGLVSSLAIVVEFALAARWLGRSSRRCSAGFPPGTRSSQQGLCTSGGSEVGDGWGALTTGIVGSVVGRQRAVEPGVQLPVGYGWVDFVARDEGEFAGTYNVFEEPVVFLAVLSPAEFDGPALIDVSRDEPWRSIRG